MLSQEVIILQKYGEYIQILCALGVLKSKHKLLAFILFTNENSDKIRL